MRVARNTGFSNLSKKKKVVALYKTIGYSMNVAFMTNITTVDYFAWLFNCTAESRASDGLADGAYKHCKQIRFCRLARTEHPNTWGYLIQKINCVYGLPMSHPSGNTALRPRRCSNAMSPPIRQLANHICNLLQHRSDPRVGLVKNIYL